MIYVIPNLHTSYTIYHFFSFCLHCFYYALSWFGSLNNLFEVFLKFFLLRLYVLNVTNVHIISTLIVQCVPQILVSCVLIFILILGLFIIVLFSFQIFADYYVICYWFLVWSSCFWRIHFMFLVPLHLFRFVLWFGATAILVHVMGRLKKVFCWCWMQYSIHTIVFYTIRSCLLIFLLRSDTFLLMILCNQLIIINCSSNYWEIQVNQFIIVDLMFLSYSPI